MKRYLLMDKVTVKQRDFQKDPQTQPLNQKSEQQAAGRLREKRSKLQRDGANQRILILWSVSYQMKTYAQFFVHINTRFQPMN